MSDWLSALEKKSLEYHCVLLCHNWNFSQLIFKPNIEYKQHSYRIRKRCFEGTSFDSILFTSRQLFLVGVSFSWTLSQFHNDIEKIKTKIKFDKTESAEVRSCLCVSFPIRLLKTKKMASFPTFENLFISLILSVFSRCLWYRTNLRGL